MRTFKTALFIAFLILSANTVSAQYNNGYGGGYGNGYGGSGYGRSNQMNQIPSTPSAPKPVPVEETAGKIVAYYKKELNLDALQEVVVKNIYIKSLKKEEILMKKEISDEEKKEEFKVLSEMTEMEIKQVLNKEQKEKFKNLIDERNSKMEARKR
ncbi:hypothetical protein [Flavobacterium aquicola]|uniref:Spy/CpxP family protein refolding chaperone n=1 Tax=Flavobacterium aquicola TaxID=1682742 RepID=A0A3E0EVL5_9FLAO|nr:hypothetical protein [Flavobacterium aquicola]REH01167.1 hypothetical protein C8P67_102430 [Flavobacterium aquicola]